MAKLILLLAIACFQFSQQKELFEAEKFNDEVLSTVNATPDTKLESDKDNWFKEKDKKDDEKWTEEDEKWLQQIQSLLEDSDEDYDDDFEETLELILEIENWIRKSHPKKGMLRWLQDLRKLFDDLDHDDWDWDFSHYPDYIKKEKNVKIAVDEKNSLDLYYSWLYRMNLKNGKNDKVQPTKRFSSV